MKKNLITAAIIIFLCNELFPQIHSTTIGGLWNDPNTWVGNIIPTAGNDVIIQGPVIHASANGYNILTEYCNNLTITSTGSLRNGDYNGGSGIYPLVVAGNIVNNGTVTNGENDFLKIFVNGNLENNNIWMPCETEFQVSSNHNLSLAPGKSFGSRIINRSETLTALTDLNFTFDWFSSGVLQRDNLYLNGHTLVLGNHSIRLYHDCVINKGKLQGDFEILGTFTVGWADGYDIRDTLVFEGNITVTDTLKGNIYGGGYGIYKLKVVGNLTNNGVIKDDVDTDEILNADDLNILITGNIYNNGIWSCNYVTFIGTETQYISQNLYKQFDSYFTDMDSGSKLQAQSDITITKDFDLNGAAIEMENYALKIDGWLSDGLINNAELHNAHLQNITSINNLIIKGTVTVDNNNTFQGSVVIDDTLQSNEYGGGSIIFTLIVDGNISNNGVIKNINDGDMLSLEISGNIINNGLWQNSFTKFIGASDHYISSLNKILNGDFYINDSASTVLANTDLAFSGNWNLGRGTIDMQHKNIFINHDKSISNGYLKDAKLNNGILSHLSLLDQIEINGRVEIENNVDAVADILINDTLSTIAYNGGTGTFYLTVYGTIENNGLFGQIYDDVLRVYVNGGIINKGIWNADQNNLIFFQNNNTCSVNCFNIGSDDMQVNGSGISGIGANSFSIISGGGVQSVLPSHSYDLSLQFTPGSEDTTATLNIDCTEIGSLNNVHLIGHNYNTTVDVEDENITDIPAEFILNQNYPNPFNPSTKISWQSPAAGWQTIKIYDAIGREIETILNEFMEAGFHSKLYIVNSTLPSGVYFFQLKTGDFIQTKKMIFMK